MHTAGVVLPNSGGAPTLKALFTAENSLFNSVLSIREAAFSYSSRHVFFILFEARECSRRAGRRSSVDRCRVSFLSGKKTLMSSCCAPAGSVGHGTKGRKDGRNRHTIAFGPSLPVEDGKRGIV